MEGGVTDRQTKERLRTRWTPPLDKIFADLVVEQIQLGTRTNNVFDKKMWSYIRDEFNKRTALNFNNNQLRKHLDVLHTRYNQVKSAHVQNDFIIEDSCAGFDLWEGIGVNPRPEPVKNKDCPIYEQLCIIFADDGADGRYAQSSHYEDVEHKSSRYAADAAAISSGHETETMIPDTPSSLRSTDYNVALSAKIGKNHIENKRKRYAEACPNGQLQREQEILDSMSKALLNMIATSKLRSFSNAPTKGSFSITNCIKALDQVEGLEDSIYFAAVDLFDDPNSRETFMSLKCDDRRLQWLQGKCGIGGFY